MPYLHSSRHHAVCFLALAILSLSLSQSFCESGSRGHGHDVCDSVSAIEDHMPGESLLQLKKGLADARSGRPTTPSVDAAMSMCEPSVDAVFPPDPSSFLRESSLHDVVGPDGVLMLSLGRDASRFQFSEEKLGIAGIRPSKMLATDGSCASEGVLSMGCVSQNNENSEWCSKLQKTGSGCEKKAEQGIADSHRRALLAAQAREHDWTMVLEDDTVLVRPQRWDDAFKRAWKKVPPSTKIIRLSWCLPGNASQIIQPTYMDAGDFKLIKWEGYATGYRAGGCTAAYMVHRDIIPEMLNLFPCCCAVDCCFENDLYNRVVGTDRSETFGMTIMLSLDGWGSQEYIAEREKSQWGVQYGVMMQALSDLTSTRTGDKTSLQ